MEANLNITGGNDVVDVGQLFQDTPNGGPVVNFTDLVNALPTVRFARPAVITTIWIRTCIFVHLFCVLFVPF